MSPVAPPKAASKERKQPCEMSLQPSSNRSDWWIAYCPEISGANGQGQTREECLESLREFILLIFDDRREGASARSAARCPPGSGHSGMKREALLRHLRWYGCYLNMNLKGVLTNLIRFFAREEIDFALIGAFALKAYGYVRATQDVDFLVKGKDQEKIIIALQVFAMKNDPRRSFRELADIQHLLELPGIDKDEVRGYFEKFGQRERFDELTGKG
jgi:predicted RNase H-like HicB family nuclease